MDRRDFLKSAAGVAGMAGVAMLGLSGGKAWASNRNGERSDVIVIGAGLAGLAAARMLQASGARVTVLEGNDRIGGRLHTIERGGLRFEVGGVEVGSDYHRLRMHAGQVGVPIIPPAISLRGAPGGRPPASSLLLGGRIVSTDAWSTDELNTLAGRERAIPPPGLLRMAVNAAALPAIDSWRDPARLALDVPLWTYLAGQGWSTQALEWMDVATSYSSLRTISALDALRRDGLRRYGGQSADWIGGGSQALPEAMAASLETSPLLNSQVASIEHSRRGVSVSCSDGRRYQAAHVVVAVPSGPLSRIRIDPLPPLAQRTVWTQRRNNSVTSIHLRPTRAFWESDGMPLNAWNDGALQNMFGIPDGNGKIERLIIWLNGKGADEADRHAPDERMAWAIRELARLRPASEGALQPLATRSWGSDKFASGAFSEIAPGQVAATLQWTDKPAGRIHFAGEHTVLDQQGMEAAVVSGERAAAAISG